MFSEVIIAIMEKREEVRRVKELLKNKDFSLANEIIKADTGEVLEQFIMKKADELIAEFEELKNVRYRTLVQALIGFNGSMDTIIKKINM